MKHRFVRRVSALALAGCLLAGRSILRPADAGQIGS